MNTLLANGKGKKGIQRQCLMLNTNKKFYKWFAQQARKNLQVGREFTIEMDLDQLSYQAPDCSPVACPTMSRSPNEINAMGSVQQSPHKCKAKILHKNGQVMAATQRPVLDTIQNSMRLYNEKRSKLEEDQLHINRGSTRSSRPRRRLIRDRSPWLSSPPSSRPRTRRPRSRRSRALRLASW